MLLWTTLLASGGGFTVPEVIAWYHPDWLYRQKITIDKDQVPGGLVDFPVAITQAVVQSALFTHAKADGSDIVLTAADGATRLKRELVHYDNSGEALELFVKVPDLSAAQDTAIYIYYGNAGAAETNDADTWDAHFGLVLHLREDPAGSAPQAIDSTANANDGTYTIAGATAEANTLWGDKAILFDNGPRLTVPESSTITDPDAITVEAWINANTWNDRETVCRKQNSYILYKFGSLFSWFLWGPDHRLEYDIPGTLGTGAWGHIVGSYDAAGGADNVRMYLNGSPVATATDTGNLGTTTGHDLGIGRHIAGVASPFNGLIDEVRISKTQRSDDWIATTCNNLSAPGTFASAAAQETAP